MNNEDVINAFWAGVPENTSWEELNKGMKIKFTYIGKQYEVETKLGNMFQFNINQYQKLLEAKAIKEVTDQKNV